MKQLIGPIYHRDNFSISESVSEPVGWFNVSRVSEIIASQSVGESVRQPVSHGGSARQLVSHLASGSVKTVSHLVGGSVRQWVIRLVGMSQLDSQSFGGSIRQSVCSCVSQTSSHSINRIVGWLLFAAVEYKFQLILKKMYTNRIPLLTLPQLQKDHLQNY